MTKKADSDGCHNKCFRKDADKGPYLEVINYPENRAGKGEYSVHFRSMYKKGERRNRHGENRKDRNNAFPCHNS
ncbi:hypothetical protein SDC9_146050 [bioreactor metagenome]|uniref:Uncharacterized protein n=1 Tax=bioreactor metagenome TaxID=1076179 RepID=A0A645EAN3_9ZZZZ